MADNNKRLVFFESAASALAAVLVQLGYAKDGDPDLADNSLDLASKVLKEQRDQLEAATARGSEAEELGIRVDQQAEELAKLREFKASSEGKISDLEEALKSAQEASGNSDQAETVQALEEKVRTLTEDLAAANAELRKGNDAKASKHRKASRTVKARVVGANAGKDGTAFETDREALAAAMDEGKELEIVFSNGSTEIVEFDPILTYAPAFIKRGQGRYDLREPLIVKGKSDETRVRGVGLLVDGEQIAYTEFPRPVKVPAGQEVKFDRMIGF